MRTLSALHRRLIWAGIVIAGCWLLFWLFGSRLADIVEARYGDVLLAKGSGKFTDAGVFVLGRIREALALGTLAIVLFPIGYVLGKLLASLRVYAAARGVVLGLIVFGLVNVWFVAAGQTVLYWSLFYNPVYIDNYAQFQMKRILEQESRTQRRALLMGNSQSSSNIDENLMNDSLQSTLWTTELHQNGARGFDLLVLTRSVKDLPAEFLIFYVSEVYFYGGSNGKVAAQFLGFRHLPDLLRLRGGNSYPPGALRSGLVGDLLPLFRHRESLSRRLLGGQIRTLDQQSFDSALDKNLEKQAAERASALEINETSRFEMAAFAMCVRESVAAGRKVILVIGQLHPALNERIDPQIRTQMTAFLQSLKEAHPGMVITVEGESILAPKDSDFVDLVHFNPDARTRFTREFVEFLKKQSLRDGRK